MMAPLLVVKQQAVMSAHAKFTIFWCSKCTDFVSVAFLPKAVDGKNKAPNLKNVSYDDIFNGAFSLPSDPRTEKAKKKDKK